MRKKYKYTKQAKGEIYREFYIIFPKIFFSVHKLNCPAVNLFGWLFTGDTVPGVLVPALADDGSTVQVVLQEDEQQPEHDHERRGLQTFQLVLQ